jgi:hypothetical protein
MITNIEPSIVRDGRKEISEEVAHMGPVLFLKMISDDFTDPDNIKEFENIKRAKIWSITGKEPGIHALMPFNQILNDTNFFSLIERLAENEIKELRFNNVDLLNCYFNIGEMPGLSRRETYPGFTIKCITVIECQIGEKFISNIFNENARVSNYLHTYTGKNLIEEINIINCYLIGYGACDNDNNRHKEIIIKKAVYELLKTNYRIKILGITNGPAYEKHGAIIDRQHLNTVQSQIDNIREFDRLIDRMLVRNRKGHQLCLSTVYTILLIKKFRYSVFDNLGKDIIKIICRLLLNTKGTKIWCN